VSAAYERDLEELRMKHELRPVTTEEDGTGVDRLPPGVYGFTYSPGTVSAPLFRNRKSENYEIHKLKDGTVVVLGYVAEAEAKALARSGEPVALRVFPHLTDEAPSLVRVPAHRIRSRREHSQREGQGLELLVEPG